MIGTGISGRWSSAVMGFGAVMGLSSPVGAVTALPGDTITYTIQTSHAIHEGLAFIEQGGNDKLYFAGQTVPALPFPVPFTFNSAKAAKVDRTLLLGSSTYGGTTHLVIGTNENFATNAVGQDFSTVFTGYDEATLLSDLDTLNSSSGDAYNKAYQDVISFGSTVAGLSSDPAFKPPMSYDLLSFSIGTIIGGGAVSELVTPLPAVPEPAAWAMMIGGIGLAGGAMRRSRVARRNIAYA